jgi:hypothetical protein
VVGIATAASMSRRCRNAPPAPRLVPRRRPSHGVRFMNTPRDDTRAAALDRIAAARERPEA